MLRALLVTLDVFAALSAIAGGLALAFGIGGDRFSVELLRGTPFRNYAVAGFSWRLWLAAAQLWPPAQGRAGGIFSRRHQCSRAVS